MTPSWLRRRRSLRRAASGPERRSSLVGYALLLRRTATEQEGAEILSSLRERYEVSPADEDGHRHRVVVDDAYDPDEAVVRLASVLDEIDRGWEDRLGWPEAIEPATSSLDSEAAESEAP